jgi:hypothetical protein
MPTAFAEHQPVMPDRSMDLPEKLVGREFSAVPIDVQPFIGEREMLTSYGERGISVLAMCSNDEASEGAAVVRTHSGRHGQVEYGVVPYRMNDDPTRGYRFNFGHVFPLKLGGAPVPISEVTGKASHEEAIAGGVIWFGLQPMEMPDREPISVVMIDPGTMVVPKTIWARERYPV